MTNTLKRIPQVTLLAAIVLITASALLVSACSESGMDAMSTEDMAARKGASDGEEVFVVAEQMPELIGGLAAIQENIEYTPIAKRAGVEGRVFLQFIVSKEGIPEEIKVTRGVGAGLDEAAVEALSKVTFIPGRQRGQAVRVKMSLPVVFRLNDGGTAGAATAPAPPRPE